MTGRWAAEVAQQIYIATSQAVCHLALHSREPNVTQSCCEVLRNFIEAGGAAMLGWGTGGKQATLETLTQIFRHLLAPDTDEAAAQAVAGLALQALLSLAQDAQAMAPQLLQLLVVKFLVCEHQSLRGQLLVVITRCEVYLLQYCMCAPSG